jgi:hypothetical protein
VTGSPLGTNRETNPGRQSEGDQRRGDGGSGRAGDYRG